MPTPPENRPTILIVKDDQQVLELLVELLEPEGYQVFSATTAKRALEVMTTVRADLILCDVVMPQMNGTELATRIGVEFPDVPVILMSAFTPAGVARVGVSETLVPVLQKPFEPTQLAQLVQLALEHPVPHRGSPGTL